MIRIYGELTFNYGKINIYTMANKSISNQSIFGEYKNQEDKVTAALLQVLHYGGHRIVCNVFNNEIDLPSNDINVSSQVQEEASRPDGYISCDCKFKIYIESKIVCNALNNEHGRSQIEANKKLSLPTSAQWVIYITPDESKPKELETASEIIWINWQTIVERLKGYEIQDNLVNFLIEQFCLFVDHIVFKKSGTVSASGIFISDSDADKDNRVIIVGGSWGEDVALKYDFYSCQEGRFFLPAKYIAFCYNNRIENIFEIVDNPIDRVILSDEILQNKYLQEKEPNYDKKPRKLFKLKHFKRFDPVIVNDTVDKNGKSCAFTYNQRYTTYDKIMKARKTSDL